ncbi:MAG: hypothetical protein C4B59_14935 [Candidatus Methanogaster sp.]|uniref:Uncharacterized protein n=1 Tax=Candidatus Methanogaster sp. TaxID=3386292 RepID=A0AC61KZ02_9EURY|nr:MAG: hypothetical protein C4B59_14935 [ANME-2 cluster archaeon]
MIGGVCKGFAIARVLVLRTGHGDEIRVKSMNGVYLFSTGSYPSSSHQRLALRCELVDGITSLIGTPVADVLLFVSVCVQVQKRILTPCKRLITTQSYSIAKK